MDKMNLERILSKETYYPFLDDIFKGLSDFGINFEQLELDHICYRVENSLRYELLRNELLLNNRLLGESEVNGRMISNFLLKKPLFYRGRHIEVLELPAPKKTSSYLEGFEHVEFVTQVKLPEFIERYPNVSFDKGGFYKVRNRDARLKIGDLSVKFHEQSLVDVIEEERLGDS